MRTAWFYGMVFCAACSHSGAGEGTLEVPATSGGSVAKGPVSFTWQSKSDASNGAIQAKLPDGSDFKGTYLQMTSEATEDDYDMYYGAWRDPVWGAPWYRGPEEGFVKQYSGRVVAHLQSDQGERMRCAFTLADPVSGMTGGGEGDCQISNKETVFDARIEPGE